MATINVVNGAKYFFDVKFTVPAEAGFTTILIKDLLELGFVNGVTVETDITITDETNSYAIKANSYTITETVPGTSNIWELQFEIDNPAVLSPAAETTFTASFPVIVGDDAALITASNANLPTGITNTAKISTDGGANFIDIPGNFTVEAATLSVFTRKAVIENNTTDIAAIIVSIPAIDTHPTTNADYILTVNLAEELANPVDPNDPSKTGGAAVQGYLQVEGGVNSLLNNGGEFTADYTDRVDGVSGGIMVINVPQQSRFKDHTLYFYFPTTLAEAYTDPSLIPTPPFLGSPVTLSFFTGEEYMLNDSNMHLTEILDVVTPPEISPGGKVIR